MNFQAKLILSALGVCALPLAQAGDFEDVGRVVRAQPRVEQIRTPHRECRTDYVEAPVAQPRSQGGSVVGGIATSHVGLHNTALVYSVAVAVLAGFEVWLTRDDKPQVTTSG